MQVQFGSIFLKKRFPLAISRGVHAGRENLFLSLTMQEVTGYGEMSPGNNEGADTVEEAQASLKHFLKENDIETLSVDEIYDLGLAQNVPTCALAALDIALWDWLAKRGGQPLYRLLGIGKPTVPTSVTIGINPPEVVRERIPLLLEGTSIRSLKVKLGSPEGFEADQAMYAQVVESAKPYGVKLRVDANGGSVSYTHLRAHET